MAPRKRNRVPEPAPEPAAPSESLRRLWPELDGRDLRRVVAEQLAEWRDDLFRT